MNVFSSCWCAELTLEVCPNIIDTPLTRQTNVIKVTIMLLKKTGPLVLWNYVCMSGYTVLMQLLLH